MTPIEFPEANTVLTRPADMTESECASIPAFVDGTHVISVWQPTADELEKLVDGAPVYLLTLGTSAPPALVTVDSPFVRIADPEAWGKTPEEVIAHIASHYTDGLPNSLQWLNKLRSMPEHLFWATVNRLRLQFGSIDPQPAVDAEGREAPEGNQA